MLSQLRPGQASCVVPAGSVSLTCPCAGLCSITPTNTFQVPELVYWGGTLLVSLCVLFQLYPFPLATCNTQNTQAAMERETDSSSPELGPESGRSGSTAADTVWPQGSPRSFWAPLLSHTTCPWGGFSLGRRVLKYSCMERQL